MRSTKVYQVGRCGWLGKCRMNCFGIGRNHCCAAPILFLSYVRGVCVYVYIYIYIYIRVPPLYYLGKTPLCEAPLFWGGGYVPKLLY